MVPAFSAALVAMTVGIACLFFDLGRSDRVVLLLISPALTHISVGAWALAATALLAALLLCAWNAASFCFPLGVVRALEALVLAAAFVSMAYTGLLLQGLNAVPLWGSVWLPVVFVLSSVSCGLAIVAAAAQVSDAAELFAAALRRLTAADAVVIAVEAVAAGLLVASVMQLANAQGAFDNTATVAAASATELLSGGSAWVFWGVFFAVGLAVPLVAEAVLFVQSHRGGRIPAKASLAVSCCVLAGGFALRFCLIQAGAHPFAYLPIA